MNKFELNKSLKMNLSSSDVNMMTEQSQVELIR